MPQAFAPPVGDDGVVAAGPDRNDVEQFQQRRAADAGRAGRQPVPERLSRVRRTSAPPGTAGPYGGNPAAAAAAGMTAAPPETQFDYANPQKYFEQRRLQQQGQQPTSVPTAVPTIGTPIGHHRPPADAAADRGPDGAGRAGAAGHRAGAAGGADAGPGRVLQPLQPPGRLGAAAGGAEQRDAGRTGSRQVQQPVQPGAAARVTPSDASGEYAERGDYHRAPDRAWDYLPTYLAKLARVRGWLNALPAGTPVLDAGCGEGVLVEEFAGRLAIEGVDANYTSPHVQRGSLLALPFPDGRFARALCLDVLEHLAYEDQPKALAELHRVLAPGGELLVSVPNLAHLQSRVHFLLTGRLIRTASEVKHPGDRPLAEYRRLFDRAGFDVLAEHGVFPTVPILTAWIRRKPADRVWLHTALTRLLPWPSLSFLAIVTLRRRASRSAATRAGTQPPTPAYTAPRAGPPEVARQELHRLRPGRRRHQHHQLPAAADLRPLPDARGLRRHRPAAVDRAGREDRLPLRPRRRVHAALLRLPRRVAPGSGWPARCSGSWPRSAASVLDGAARRHAAAGADDGPRRLPGRAAHPAGQHVHHRLLLHPVPRPADDQSAGDVRGPDDQPLGGDAADALRARSSASTSA